MLSKPRLIRGRLPVITSLLEREYEAELGINTMSNSTQQDMLGLHYPSHEQTLTCFGKLPTEIRLKIWNESLPGPRILTATMALRWRPEGHRRPLFRLISPPPVVFHVCKESREQALGMYSLQLTKPSFPHFYRIDPEEDTVYVVHAIDPVGWILVMYSRETTFLSS